MTQNAALVSPARARRRVLLVLLAVTLVSLPVGAAGPGERDAPDGAWATVQAMWANAWSWMGAPSRELAGGTVKARVDAADRDRDRTGGERPRRENPTLTKAVAAIDPKG